MAVDPQEAPGLADLFSQKEFPFGIIISKETSPQVRLAPRPIKNGSGPTFSRTCGLAVNKSANQALLRHPRATRGSPALPAGGRCDPGCAPRLHPRRA